MLRTYQFPELAGLSDRLRAVDCFVVGEMHGILENARIMERLLELAWQLDLPVSVGFEWLLPEGSDFESFLLGDVQSCEVPGFVGASDGRFTEAHVDLLRRIRAYNRAHPDRRVKVFGFDATAVTEYEQAMAKQVRARRVPDTLTLLATGVVHARRSDSGTSLVDCLAEGLRTETAFVSYESGSVTVEGAVYSVVDAYQQQLGPADDFDHVVTVPTASPADESLALTKARNFMRCNGGGE